MNKTFIKLVQIIALMMSLQFLAGCKKDNGTVFPGEESGNGNNGGLGQVEPTPTPVVIQPTPTPVVVQPTPSPTPDIVVNPPVNEPGIVLPPRDEDSSNVIKIAGVGGQQNFTYVPAVSLLINKRSQLKMKISDNDTCTGGTWEDYKTEKAWQLSKMNQLNYVSVRFIDVDDTETACYKNWIIHDQLAPEVSIKLASTNSYLHLSDVKFSISVIDRGIGTQSYSCLLNEKPISCTTLSENTLSQLVGGEYVLKLMAYDKFGAFGETKVQFSVKQPLVAKTTEVTIERNNKVDILFVIDNSGSMSYEQKNMATRMKDFTSLISNLDWQIGVTTTDPRDITLGDGRLVTLTGLGNKYILTPSQADASSYLGRTLQRTETGSGSEQGVYVTRRALERSLLTSNSPNANQQLFRKSADLAVVLISDEDESARNDKNKPESLLNYVKTNWPTKNFTFHSIITRPNDKKCLDGEGESYGTVYDQMSRLTGFGQVGGAIIGSVCATDYSSQLKGIGQSVKDMEKIITLSCAPQGNVQTDITVIKDGSVFNEEFTVQDNKLVFTNGLQAGVYSVDYLCAQ